MADARLRAVPLGGLGHVGGNMMVYETPEDVVIVDCGVLFPTADQPGVDYVIPDIGYVLERRDKLRGYVITHGHEDHLGALPFVLPEAPAPVYGTALTLAFLANKLGEHPDVEADLREIRDGVPFQIGGLTVEPIPVAHSIPDAVALAIETPIGRIVHTGDFKIDEDAPDGRLTGVDRLREIGDDGVAVLFSDSTNSERSGSTWGEREIAGNLAELIAESTNRVIVTTFASNLHRIQAILDASQRAGRKVMPVGRSVQQNLQLGLERGYLKAAYASVRDPSDFDNVLPSQLTIIASGSQGEPRSAMTRIAAGQHGHVKLEPGDRVILSARRIPGNERAIGQMVNNLWRLGAEVIDDRVARVHTSGHAFNDEQRRIIELCRPSSFVPIHGEYRHLRRHAALARDAGVAADRVCVVEDGSPVEILRHEGGTSIRVGEPVAAGHVFVDGKGVGDVEEVVLRDRRVLSATGMVICVTILGEDGTLVAGPHIISRGVLHEDANPEIVDRAVSVVEQALSKEPRWLDVGSCADTIRVALRRFFRRELDRRPLILPVVMSL